MQLKTVKITRVHEDIEEILKEAIADTDLSGKQKVFIKPNMSNPVYVPGVVTSPALLGKLVGLLRDEAEEVIVGESNGFNYPCRSIFC